MLCAFCCELLQSVLIFVAELWQLLMVHISLALMLAQVVSGLRW